MGASKDNHGSAVRAARMDDYDALCALLKQSDDDHRRMLPGVYAEYEGPARSRDFIAGFVEADDADVLVAHRDGEAVGCVGVRLERRTASHAERHVFADDLFVRVSALVVDHAARRSGVGRALMDAATRWAAERGASRVVLGFWCANTDARAFYEALGFTPLYMGMERRVDANAGVGERDGDRDPDCDA